jgi:tetratricopeptide (TPR) repeat protein
MALEHLETWPRDAVILSLPLGPFGLYAFSGMPDHIPHRLALCELYRAHHENDWWFQSMYGFVLVESGETARARPLIETALATRPDNANGAHDLAHVLHETGKAAEADAFIERWLPAYDRRGILHGHLAWHQALFALDQGEPDRALSLYQTHVRPSASEALDINILTDAASFLWRLGLYGHPADPALWRETADFAETTYGGPGLAFVDVHWAMAAAAAGDDDALTARLEALTTRHDAGSYRAGPIGPASYKALKAFADGRYADCAALLEPLTTEVARIGGSNAQREVMEETLLVAWMRSGQVAKARGLLEQRLARRPTGRDQRWMAAL